MNPFPCPACLKGKVTWRALPESTFPPKGLWIEVHPAIEDRLTDPKNPKFVGGIERAIKVLVPPDAPRLPQCDKCSFSCLSPKTLGELEVRLGRPLFYEQLPLGEPRKEPEVRPHRKKKSAKN